jgi:hypothetical protein
VRALLGACQGNGALHGIGSHRHPILLLYLLYLLYFLNFLNLLYLLLFPLQYFSAHSQRGMLLDSSQRLS